MVNGRNARWLEKAQDRVAWKLLQAGFLSCTYDFGALSYAVFPLDRDVQTLRKVFLCNLNRLLIVKFSVEPKPRLDVKAITYRSLA